ncbi:MAG: long-chain fatty acid--CoA ligase [Bryobacterales bacterium]|nr:long-chain fatty acid--CoA ligase [Bryobacterales bacterium]
MLKRTVYSLLEEAATAHGELVALHQPVTTTEGRGYRTYSWIEYRTIVREIACGLRSMGIQNGEMVGVGSETRAEFYLLDLGIMANGSTSAALYVNSQAMDQVSALRRCGAKLIFVEDGKIYKALHAAGGAELGAQWVVMSGLIDGVMTLDEVRSRGRAAMLDDPEYFERIRLNVMPEQRAILYLTSGATGEPKFVEVSHASLVANVDIGKKALNMGPKDRVLAFLPSAHIAQRVGIELLPLGLGIPVYFSEGLARMAQEFKSIKPTFFLAPPRVWERVYHSVRTEIQKRGGATKKLFYVAVGMSAAAVKLRAEGKPVPLWMRTPLALFDRLVFSKVRERMGGELTFAVSGAAPLAKELALFYEAIGMPLHEGFGLTEGGILTLNLPGKQWMGSIGPALPGIHLKLADDGELLVSGPTVAMGYFNDAKATADVFRDGWLYTGDIAEIGKDGYVSITGRKKEIIVSSNGKKIYPTRVEELFKTDTLISQMVLAGDGQPHISALFTINAAAAVNGQTLEELAASAEVLAAVKKSVRAANAQLAAYEQIKKFRVLPVEFSIEGGELTPTMKVRRSKVLEKFADKVAEMYAAKDDLL